MFVIRSLAGGHLILITLQTYKVPGTRHISIYKTLLRHGVYFNFCYRLLLGLEVALQDYLFEKSSASIFFILFQIFFILIRQVASKQMSHLMVNDHCRSWIYATPAVTHTFPTFEKFMNRYSSFPRNAVNETLFAFQNIPMTSKKLGHNKFL